MVVRNPLLATTKVCYNGLGGGKLLDAFSYSAHHRQTTLPFVFIVHWTQAFRRTRTPRAARNRPIVGTAKTGHFQTLCCVATTSINRTSTASNILGYRLRTTKISRNTRPMYTYYSRNIREGLSNAGKHDFVEWLRKCFQSCRCTCDVCFYPITRTVIQNVGCASGASVVRRGRNATSEKSSFGPFDHQAFSSF